jgi:transcription antitermination factor NusA-like protein
MPDELVKGQVTVASVVRSESARNRVRIGPSNPSDRQAAILVQKDGQRIDSIIVTCPCGETITIVCDYE